LDKEEFEKDENEPSRKEDATVPLPSFSVSPSTVAAFTTLAN